jgi:transcriptional regulator with XRE-family HTH domain
MDQLKDRLQKALALSGKTQADLARHCGVTPASVADWFSSETKNMKSVPLLLAAELLNVRPLWLARGQPPMLTRYGEIAPASVVQAKESRSDEWPFRFITPARWMRLPPIDRARIETFADATLQAWEARHPDKSNGTSG